ncbi:MAG: hypothetical protein NTX03_08975 [Bacteroidetes bacterium]|nr:hypothetical protein [Bacteroidota bacterium]
MKSRFFYFVFFVLTFFIYCFLYLIDIPIKARKRTKRFMQEYFAEVPKLWQEEV